VPGPVDGESLTYRPTAVRLAALAVVAFCLWWTVAGFAAGRWHETGLDLPLLLGVCTLAYAVLWRPAVTVNGRGIELWNVFRMVRVPWHCLVRVDTRFALTLVTETRGWQSWAAAAPGRPGVLGRMGGGETIFGNARSRGARDDRRSAVQGPGRNPSAEQPPGPRSSRDLRADSGAAAFMVEQRWAAWRDGPGARAMRNQGGGPQDPAPGTGGPAGSSGETVEVRWFRGSTFLLGFCVVVEVILRVLGT